MKDETDNAYAIYDYIHTPHLQKLMVRNKASPTRDLTVFGHYCLVHHGFRDTGFCDEERGLKGALPPEILHFMQSMG